MATLDNELGFGAADSQGASAKTSAVWLQDDAGTDKLTFKDVTTELKLDEISTVTDHGALAGLADDDHSAGASAYQTAARHLTAHDAAFNNALTISGAIEADGTVGAHVANADIHYLRPSQTLTVAKNGTGQFATVAAALAAIGTTLPAASANNPYEIAIYPGDYAESNLTVNPYVSLRSVVPRLANISQTSSSPILTIGGESMLNGLSVQNIDIVAAGNAVKLTASASGNVRIINCLLSASGDTIDFNATNQKVIIQDGSNIVSTLQSWIVGKTAPSGIDASDSEFSSDAAESVASMIDIDVSDVTVGDTFDSCRFLTDFSAGATPIAIVDFDGTDIEFRNCFFRASAASGKTVNQVLCQSGTVTLQGCLFDWITTTGTSWDLNAAGGATIQHAACVYSVARTTGAGTISAMSEGAGLFDAISMTGPLSITAPDAQLIDLAPSGTGNTDVIRIIPSAALAAANSWKGLKIDGTALDPAAAGASVFGGHIDLSGIDQTNNPILCGLLINMPAVATTTEAFHAIKLTGNGNELVLLNKDFLLDLTATGSAIPLVATYSDTATNTVENAACFKHLTSADMVDGFGVSICMHVEDDTSGDQTIATIKAYRADGLDNNGAVEFGGGLGGTDFFLKFNGNAGGVDLPLASATGNGLSFGGGPGEIYRNAFGLVISDPGGDPLIIGDTVTIKLGDAAGVERFSIHDSNDVEQAFLVSSGEWFAAAYGNSADTNTRLIFPVDDALALQAGGVEFLRCAEAAQDELVINEGGLDIDFRVEAVGAPNAIVSDGATGNITMSETLTVGSGVVEKILGITNGTQTAMLGYDGIPHLALDGDSTFIFYSKDTDSDMNLIARADGTGTGRVRAQTSGSEYIDIYHDGVRGRVDSSLGGIRLNDAVDFQGAVVYNDTFWEDLRVPLVSAKAGASNMPDFAQFADDGAGSAGVFVYAFDNAAEESLFFVAQLPHSYKGGTDIFPHVHWSPNGTGAAGQFVKWGLEYTWANRQGVYGNTTIITTDASSAATATRSGDGTMLDHKHYESLFDAIDGTGKTLSSILICRMFRDATDADDDYPNDAFGFELDFHFEIDTPGSLTEDEI